MWKANLHEIYAEYSRAFISSRFGAFSTDNELSRNLIREGSQLKYFGTFIELFYIGSHNFNEFLN